MQPLHLPRAPSARLSRHTIRGNLLWVLLIYLIREKLADRTSLCPHSTRLELRHNRSLSLKSEAGRGVVSFQITILKVLAGQPEGRASHPDVTRAVAILMSSGADWSNRMKRLAARAPDLSIYCSNYVARDSAGWQITDAGRAFLIAIEAPECEPVRLDPESVPITQQHGDQPSNVIDLVHRLVERRPPRERSKVKLPIAESAPTAATI